MRKILCVVGFFIFFSFSMTLFVQAEDVPDLQMQSEELRNQINEANGELQDVQEELSENLKQVQKLDEKINKSQEEIDILDMKINSIQKSIEDVSIRLKIAEETYAKQKDVLDKRLVAMYESSDTQYLDVLLTSRNVSEFLSNYFLITEITKNDTELLNEMKSKKDTIELEKKKLDENQNELAEIKQNQIKTAKILENSKAIRENYISKLSEQEQEIQSKIDAYYVQFAAINKDILLLALESLDSQYIGGELAWPVPGYTRITSKYGMRTHPITGVYKLHTGVDISAPMGANFVAANDGIVVKAEYNGAYGNMVIIDHGGGVSTLYAHGSEIMVNVGDVVKRGKDVVLKVGSTGYSTGAHAHFEVRFDGTVTDPIPYITNGIIPKSEIENKEENTEKQ